MFAILLAVAIQAPPAPPPARARDLGIVIGTLPTGPHNAITDVKGVRVGHCSLRRGDHIRTGVTVILPHTGNLFAEKVPAAVVIGNGYGKLIGSTQIHELGEIESPIALTNTLNVGKVADALVEWSLDQTGNAKVRSVNVVVGETNDGYLNDIRGRHVNAEHLRTALAAATGGAVAEGAVGAGTGTVCFGYKGGIGTASRRVSSYVVGVLCQSNFGGQLQIAGQPVPPAKPRAARDQKQTKDDGSCMIIVATDAPLDARNLARLGRRALHGMARTGASFSNGSGDYVVAFCTAPSQRIRADGKSTTGGPVLRNDRMSPLFRAVADATEEAILNSLFMATTTSGRDGHRVTAIRWRPK